MEDNNVYKINNESTNTGNGTFTTNTAGLINSNCGSSGSGSSVVQYPRITYPTYTQNYTPLNKIEIQRVENGWILIKNYKTYIIKKEEEILKYLKDEEK